MPEEPGKPVRSHDDQVSELCSDLRASLTALESKITVELSEAEERGAADQRRKDGEVQNAGAATHFYANGCYYNTLQAALREHPLPVIIPLHEVPSTTPEVEALKTRLTDLEGKARNLLIAVGMGWDTEGTIKTLREVLGSEGGAYKKSADDLIEHYRKKYPETAAAWAENSPRKETITLFQHIKRGTKYRLIGRGHLQMNGPQDMADVVLYQDIDNGSFWARPASEFYDGRFKAIFAEASKDRGQADDGEL